jgi:hypothetical protein
MERDLIEYDFLKIKKTIDSIEHGGQIECGERLINLFMKKHFKEDFTSDEEISLESYKTELKRHLKFKTLKYSIVDDDY